MPIKHGRAASVKSALIFSRRKTTSLLTTYVDEAGRRLPQSAVSSWWTSQVLSSPALVSPLEKGEGNGPSHAWQQVATGGLCATWMPLLAPLEAWWELGGGDLTPSSTSGIMTAAQTSAWVWTWLPGPPAAYSETLAFLQVCAAHQLLLSAKVCRGVSIFRMPLPPLHILKTIDSEWDAVSPPIIKASSDSCSGRVPPAAGLPDFLCGILSSI